MRLVGSALYRFAFGRVDYACRQASSSLNGSDCASRLLPLRAHDRAGQSANKPLQLVKRDMKPVSYIALRPSLAPELAENLVPDARCFALNSPRFARSETASSKLDARRFVLPFAEKAERSKPICHSHCRHAPARFGLDYCIYRNESGHPCPHIVRGHQKC
jgi:hypothetical protein